MSLTAAGALGLSSLGLSRAAVVPVCMTHQLRISEQASQGAAGTWLLVLAYRNAGVAHCRTGGYPGVTLYTRGGTRLPPVKRERARSVSFDLKAGQRAYGVITYPDNTGGRCRVVNAVRIYAPNSREASVLRVRHAGRACGSRNLRVDPLGTSARSAPRRFTVPRWTPSIQRFGAHVGTEMCEQTSANQELFSSVAEEPRGADFYFPATDPKRQPRLREASPADAPRRSRKEPP